MVVKKKPQSNPKPNKFGIRKFNEGIKIGYESAKLDFTSNEKILEKRISELRDENARIRQTNVQELLSVFGQSIQAMADLLRRAKE